LKKANINPFGKKKSSTEKERKIRLKYSGERISGRLAVYHIYKSGSVK
jgi:hypothetical protein